jgi:hypothetical protein
MKTHLFLATAVGLAITVTTSHAALGRSLDETIQHYGPTPTISTSGIVDNCFDGRAQVLWDV